MQNQTGTTQVILAVSLLAVAAATFAISAGSLYELAEAKHMAFPWLVPVMVDLSILAVSIAAFSASCRGNDGWGLSALAWSFTALSAGLNVCHVWTDPPDVVACFLHGMPPIVTTVVFEVLLHDMRQARLVTLATCDTPTAAQSVTLPPETVTPDKPKRERVTRRKRHTANENETMAERAKALGMSVRKLYRMRAKGVNV